MRTKSQRLQSLLIVVAVLFGGCLTSLATPPGEQPMARDLSFSHAWAKVAVAVTSPAGLAAALSETNLVAPLWQLLQAKLSSNNEPADSSEQATVPPDTMLDEPLFAGGAGGDEPAGPWP